MKSTLRAFRGLVPECGARTWIDPDASVIGKVRLGDDVSIWPGAVLRGDVHRIEIGARTNIQDNTVCHVTHDGPQVPGGYPLVVGEDVTVGHAAVLHACTIGDRCLVGMGALVLDGAQIEADVMIGAGSLVPPGKRLESGCLYVGRPARAVRRLSEDELSMLRYSAAHYVRLKDDYLLEHEMGTNG